jgi:hypothetical protein
VNQARAENRVEESFPASEGDLASNIRSAARLLVQPLLETRSGFLFVEANEWGAEVYLDGRLIGTTPVGRHKARSGYHRVSVQKDNFIVWQRDVKVAPEQATSVAVGLIPSPDYVKAFRHQQRTMDISAWSTLGVGLASLVSGVGVLTWNELERGNHNDKRDLWVRCLGEPALPECGGIDTSGANSPYYQDLRKRRDDIKTRSAVSGALLGVGSAALITSVVLFILEEDPAKYDHLVDEDGRPILQKELGQAQDPTTFGTQRRFPVGTGRAKRRSLYGRDWRIDVAFFPNRSGSGIEFMFRF